MGLDPPDPIKQGMKPLPAPRTLSFEPPSISQSTVLGKRFTLPGPHQRKNHVRVAGPALPIQTSRAVQETHTTVPRGLVLPRMHAVDGGGIPVGATLEQHIQRDLESHGIRLANVIEI